MRNSVLLIFLLLYSIMTFGRNQFKELVYKRVDTTSLKMQIYYPENFDREKKYPAIVLFFGGSWNTGSVDQFRPHAQYFASQGMSGHCCGL